ncbi:MAG TPA: TIGR03960 family B12-binding radical SAM protein [Clostridiaceae bacterium]|nr:TIGR03960 family B12-binding radical SAM protein [Clostridiaceae bacterium]
MSVFIDDDILMQVEKPARYTGNEWNMVKKDPKSKEISIRFAFCFPDIYEIGMSHLGMRILYHLINERNDTYCERVFAPWTDMEEIMRQKGIPLFALETKDPISDFDFIGFTLQYEMSYTNVLNMLDLAGIPIRSKDRTEQHPFVCAGGPCACNPEPLADIIDFFVIGEAEEVINEILDVYKRWKTGESDGITRENTGVKEENESIDDETNTTVKNGQTKGKSRESFLRMIAKIEGVYVPSFYEVKYNDDGTIKSIQPKSNEFPAKIRKKIIKDLDQAYYPEKMIVPYINIVHDRIILEIFRGCTRGCRFCQAGFIYRPVREKKPEKLVHLAEKLQQSTGYEEISLASLSTSDYTGLKELTEDLINNMSEKRVSLSLPSLRVDSFSLSLMEKAQSVRKSGLTFAPEAGTQRLRDVINKGVTEEDLLESVRIAFEGGWSTVKLYFMIGLPTETLDDIAGISELGEKVVSAYMATPKEKRGKGLNVTISTSCFVPKPFTPFQWESQDSIETLREKQKYLKGLIKSKYIRYNWHDPEISFLEAVFARGDRRTGEVLIRAWEKGCKFDSWGDSFDFSKWMEAFKECQVDPHFYANRKRNYDEVFPWEHIDIGVTKKFLQRENEKAYRGELTDNCRVKCNYCGATVFGGGVCYE